MKMESYKVVAFFLVLMFANGMALKCRNCLSTKSFDECQKMGPILECNSTIVNQNHETFKEYNPSLQPGNGTEFKCYRFEAARLFPNNTDTGLRGYALGCTFLNTTFCTGWNSTLNITCSTCLTDNCEQNPPQTSTVQPQTSTVPPQTSTVKPQTSTVPPQSSAVPPQSSAVPPQSSTPSSQVTTTTNKPNNAAVVTLSSLTNLSCLSILFVLAAR